MDYVIGIDRAGFTNRVLGTFRFSQKV